MAERTPLEQENERSPATLDDVHANRATHGYGYCRCFPECFSLPAAAPSPVEAPPLVATKACSDA